MQMEALKNRMDEVIDGLNNAYQLYLRKIDEYRKLEQELQIGKNKVSEEEYIEFDKWKKSKFESFIETHLDNLLCVSDEFNV